MAAYSYLVKLSDGGQVDEHGVVFDLHREGQELHVGVLHVVQALAAEAFVQEHTTASKSM